MKQSVWIGFLGLMGLSLFYSSCDSGNSGLNCGKFRNGLFRHQSRSEGMGDILIRRSDSIQVETYMNTGQSSTFRVTWTSPCNYELKMIETSFDYPDSIQQLRMNTILYVQILNFDKEYYRYGVSDKKGQIDLKDTLWVERRLRNLEK